MTIRSYQFGVSVLVTVPNLDFTVETQLNLSSEATEGVRRDVTTQIPFTSQATWEVQPAGIAAASSELNLVSTVDSPNFKFPSNELSLGSSASVTVLNTKTPRSQLELILQSTAEYRFGVQNRTVETELGLSSDVRQIFDRSVQSILTMGSVACRLFTAETDLNLQSEAFRFNLFVTTDLDLSQDLELNKTLNQNIVHDNVVSQAVTYFIEKPCERYSFSAFHGEGGSEPAAKRLQYNSTFYLQSIDDGELIELRNPEMDDRQRVAFNRVNRTFFDGSPDVFSADEWATEETQIYTIIANKREKLEPLQAFLQNNLGREVILKDWKGTTWVVIITNPGDLYTEDGEDFWTLNFEVEGSAFDGEWFISPLEMDQDVSRAGSIYNRVGTSSLGLSQNTGRAYDVDGDETELSSPIGLSQEVSYTIE